MKSSGSPMRVLFLIQGEGRGHMTQALALQTILENAGHEVGQVLVGSSSRKTIPEFFMNKIHAPVKHLQSPNFITDDNDRAINIYRTIIYNVAKIGTYRDSLQTIQRYVDLVRPDLLISFYELLGGLYGLFYQPETPIVTIGHQFMFFSPGYEFPDGMLMDRLMTKFYTWINGLGSRKRLALSYYPEPDPPGTNISVVPPLLRDELFRQSTDEEQDFLLLYLLNSGYSENIIRWHKENPGVKLHCFWDRTDVEEEYRYDETLIFHQLDDRKFLDKMARCKGLVCTAGFESISEGLYLNKPICMIPTGGHFEQMANALDAMSIGAGIYVEDYHLDTFLDFIPKYNSDPEDFRDWVGKAPEIFLQELETVNLTS